MTWPCYLCNTPHADREALRAHLQAVHHYARPATLAATHYPYRSCAICMARLERQHG